MLTSPVLVYSTAEAAIFRRLFVILGQCDRYSMMLRAQREFLKTQDKMNCV